MTYLAAAVRGSSPLTRGARHRHEARRCRRRLIPAHAGSTDLADHSVLELAAHPRSRGEHIIQGLVTMLQGGSSPLTRGAPDRSVVAADEVRLIPAHAGSTVGTSSAGY